jgi:hypothetical protein
VRTDLSGKESQQFLGLEPAKFQIMFRRDVLLDG